MRAIIVIVRAGGVGSPDVYNVMMSTNGSKFACTKHSFIPSLTNPFFPVTQIRSQFFRSAM